MQRTTKSLLITAPTLCLGLAGLVMAPSTARGKPGEKARARKQFERLDKNKNGFIERVEFPADDEAFRRADRDGDGQINFPEAVELMIQNRVEKTFMQLDKDRDGFIRLDEMPGEKERRQFPFLDANADGRVSGEELLGAIRTEFEKDDGVEEAGKMPELRLPPTWEQVLVVDRNKNGALENDEIPTVKPDAFARLDANGDGSVSKEEYQTIRPRVLRAVIATKRLQAKLVRIGQALKAIDLDKAEKLLRELEALPEMPGEKTKPRNNNKKF